MPLILTLCLMAIANSSTAMTKVLADHWHPCLTPLVTVNPSDISPLLIMWLLILL